MVNSLDFVNNFQVTCEDGVTYQLYGGNPVNFESLDGIGVPDIRRITQKTPQQHGAIDKGFRLEPRRMTLTLTWAAPDQTGADQRRDKLAYIFGPTDAPITLKITKADGTVRAIDCFVDGSFDFPMSQRIGASDTVVIPLLAPDPSFYDPVQRIVTVDLSSGSGDTGTDIDVSGVTWDDWPIIDLVGPLDFPAISHSPLDGAIIFISNIADGDTYRMDMRPGYKTVRRTSDDAPRLGYVSLDSLSSFSTLRVMSEKSVQELIPGQTWTRYFFETTGTNANSQAIVYWYKRYLSL